MLIDVLTLRRVLKVTAALRVALPLLALVILTPTVAGQDAEWDDEKISVLFISVDDMNGAMGAMGDPLARTPNLDRLARSGVLFNRAYCQLPSCNPSRASFLTGLRPDTLRVYDLDTNFRDNVRAGTLPQLFKNEGYFSGRVGKIFHYGVPRQIGSGGLDDANSWSWAINPRGRDKDEEHKLHVLTRGTGTTLGYAMAWLEMEGTDEEQTDGIGVDETIAMIDRYGLEQPFWIGMGFFRPHTPFVATKKWFDLYPKDQISLPERPPGETDDIPPIAMKIPEPDYGLDESDLLDCIRGYYASISFIDDQVGKLMRAIEERDLVDNTIIVFVSDHGFLLGEHHQWQKQMLFEEAARVPLIIVPPGGLREEKTNEADWKCERVVELLDIYPTIVAMAGMRQPVQKLEGRDLTPLLEDPQAEWDGIALTQDSRRVDGENTMGYSVRTERWRYTEWGKDGEYGRELYDHENDPREFNNVANYPEHADTIRDLKQRMVRLAPASSAGAGMAK